jgi:hypothetical protein
MSPAVNWGYIAWYAGGYPIDDGIGEIEALATSTDLSIREIQRK